MNAKEARTVASIMVTADGGCHICAAGLAEKFLEVWPEHLDVLNEVYTKELGFTMKLDSFGEWTR